MADNLDSLLCKMDTCSKSLARWNKVAGASLKNKIKKAENDYVGSLARLENGGSMEKVDQYRDEQDSLILDYEIFCKQRAKVKWL